MPVPSASSSSVLRIEVMSTVSGSTLPAIALTLSFVWEVLLLVGAGDGRVCVDGAPVVV
jgi:hypothetical protein